DKVRSQENHDYSKASPFRWNVNGRSQPVFCLTAEFEARKGIIVRYLRENCDQSLQSKRRIAGFLQGVRKDSVVRDVQCVFVRGIPKDDCRLFGQLVHGCIEAKMIIGHLES
nr:hypothetical protein [Tanacetum cinerariifolium]